MWPDDDVTMRHHTYIYSIYPDQVKRKGREREREGPYEEREAARLVDMMRRLNK